MAQYPGSNIVTFVQSWAYKGAYCFSNSFYYEMAGAGSVTKTNVNDVAEGANNQIGGTIAELLSNDMSIINTRARVFAPNDLIEGFSSGVFNGSGNGVIAGTIPLEVSAVVQRRTGKFGRSFMGRIFIAGIAPNYATGNELVPAGQTVLKGIADTLGQDLTLGGVTLHARHWNRKQNTFVPITKCVGIRELKSRIDRRPTHRSTAVNA